MKKKLIVLVSLILSLQANAQIGGRNMGLMNALMEQFGAKNESLLRYEPRFGLVDQKLMGFTDHYTIKDIQNIIVTKVKDGATVQFLCNPTDPCISHISDNNTSSYLPSVNYYFFQEEAANKFAALAMEIISQDFSKKVDVIFSMPNYSGKTEMAVDGKDKKQEKNFLQIGNDDGPEDEIEIVEKPIPKKKKKQAAQKPARTSSEKENFLSLKTYNDDLEESAKADLNAFGKKLIAVLELAEKHQLASIKSGSGSSIKLPKAKKNYINEYKGAPCFIAEFGTEQYYEDLEELYYQLNDELGASLPQVYEPVDMAYEEIYKNSDDEIFHTEYYNVENPSAPSVVIRIAPDGEKNTLFIRIGKR